MRRPGAAHQAYEPMTPIRLEKIQTATKIAVAVPLLLLVSFGAYIYFLGWQNTLVKSRSASGRAALESGDYERAVRNLEFVVQKRQSPSPAVLHWLGVAYIKRGEELINALPPDDSRYKREMLAESAALLTRKAKPARETKRGDAATSGATTTRGKANP